MGAASLAFTDQPGENLQRVARGASLGLYAGIALGFYVMSLTPGDFEDDLDLPPEEEPVPSEEGYDEDEYGGSIIPKIITPLVASNGKIEGGYAVWHLLSF